MMQRHITPGARLAAILLAAGCACGSAQGGDDAIDLGRGPVPIFVPSTYDDSNPAPLVLLLHGWLWDGQLQENWFQFEAQAEAHGCLYAYPDGTVGPDGIRFWNATDACCDFYDSEVDDAGYLADLIDAIGELWNVDQQRIWIVGHSNGGFMAHRMACEYPNTVAAIVSFAGAAYNDPLLCSAGAPVHVLGIHGTLDLSVLYGGGNYFGVPYPGAVESVEQWVLRNGCFPLGEEQDEHLNLTVDVFGSETVVTRYDNGCDPGGLGELWSMSLAGHYPVLTSQFAPLVFEYLAAHPKPASCLPDLDGSGAVDFPDLLSLLSTWGPCTACPEDLDGNASVDFADLLVMLSAWGACP